MITVNGRKLMVERYKKILIAQNDLIVIEMSEGRLSVTGKDMNLKAMTSDEILLQGEFACLRIDDHER